MTQSQLQEQLRSLRLGHFAQALQQQQSQATTYDEMSFEEHLGLLAPVSYTHLTLPTS